MSIEKFYMDLNNHFNKIRTNAVGLDRLFDNIHDYTLNSIHMTTSNHSSYPPYNVTKMDKNSIQELGLGVADNVQEQVTIELALAGFKKEELQVEQKENILIVSGRSEPSDESNHAVTVVKKIGKRQFKREFLLSDNTEISNCDYVDGVLSITIDVIVPPEEQAKIININ
jgi:molecular chaperone IbpA